MVVPAQNLKVAIVGSSSAYKDYPDQLDILRNAGIQVDRFEIPSKPQPDNPLAIARKGETNEDLARKLADYDGIILSVDPDIPAEVLEQLEKCKVIARHGIGFNNVDVNAALALGIVVTKVVGWVEQASVAELATTYSGLMSLAKLDKNADAQMPLSEAVVATLGDLSRQISPSHDSLSQGIWENRNEFHGPEVSGRKVGIVGYGQSGQEAAAALKAMNDLVPGGEVMIYDPYITGVHAQDLERQGYKVVGLDDLCKNAEFISTQDCYNGGEEQLIQEDHFDLIKTGTCLVDTLPDNQLSFLAGEKEIKHAYVDSRNEQFVKNSSELDPKNNVGIAGKKVGIIGCGNIGAGAAKIYKAMAEQQPGGEVLVNDPGVDDDVIRAMGCTPVTLHELCEQSDIVSIHSSCDQTNEFFIDESCFSKMKEGVTIVNTARGKLINEEDLLPYLDKGLLSYATDVFHPEPPQNSGLVGHPNVKHGQHLGGYGDSSKIGMGLACVLAVYEVLVSSTVPEEVVNTVDPRLPEAPVVELVPPQQKANRGDQKFKVE